jgi:hypothetical protein
MRLSTLLAVVEDDLLDPIFRRPQTTPVALLQELFFQSLPHGAKHRANRYFW